MRVFQVIMPIAGHACVVVEAENEDDAINKAMEVVMRDDIEEWEALREFNTGNICHCPSPWEIEVTDETPDE